MTGAHFMEDRTQVNEKTRKDEYALWKPQNLGKLAGSQDQHFYGSYVAQVSKQTAQGEHILWKPQSSGE